MKMILFRVTDEKLINEDVHGDVEENDFISQLNCFEREEKIFLSNELLKNSFGKRRNERMTRRVH